MAGFTNLPLHRKLTAIIVSTTVVAICSVVDGNRRL